MPFQRPDGAYKTIFSNSVLEHIPDLRPVLKEVHRLLAPDGMFFVTVPSDLFEQNTWINRFLLCVALNGLAARFRKWFNSFWRHYHCYPLEKWQVLMQEAGFEVVESLYVQSGADVFAQRFPGAIQSAVAGAQAHDQPLGSVSRIAHCPAGPCTRRRESAASRGGEI